MLICVGIKIVVEIMLWFVYFGCVLWGSFEGLLEFSFILVGWGVGFGEVFFLLKFLIYIYDKDRGFGFFNCGCYFNVEIDVKIEEVLWMVDDEKWQDFLVEVMEMVIVDLVIILIYFQVNIWVVKKGLKYIVWIDEYIFVMGVVKE